MQAAAKIHVVEDQDHDALLIKQAFKKFDDKYNISFSRTLSQAIEYISSQKIDLLIVDLSLPDGKGTDLVEWIKKGKIKIPIVILTSQGDEESAVSCFKNGALDYLKKRPETFLSLCNTCEKILRDWQKTVKDKQNLETLIRLEQKFRLLTESISDILWFIDPTFSRYTFISKSIEKFLGYTPREMMHLPVIHTLDYDSSKKVQQVLGVIKHKLSKGTLKETDRYMEEELVFEHKDGSLRWGEVKSKVLIEKNKLIGFTGVTRDITDRKISEGHKEEIADLKHKMQVSDRVARIKEQFLANMSHEIRTPMTGIMGMTEMLMKTSLDESQRKYLDTIHSSASSLLKIVNQILDLSRLKAGKAQLRPSVFNLEENGRRIMGLFSALLEQKKLQSSFSYDSSLPKQIKADEYRLGQIITNLLGNAIKFTEKGYVRVSFSQVARLDHQVRIRLEVVDSGIGISKEDQQRLFEIFSQVDDSDTRNHGGAGLGLSLSQKFALMMGGNIKLESTPGEGSRFWFDFVAEIHSQEHEDEMHDEFIESSPCHQYKVLLVEDKKTNQMVISLMLQDAGCQVDLANDGHEAIQKFEPGKYDIIFMDIQMPVMDGLSATKELKSRFPASQLPPIIGLSAKALKGDAEYYIAEGLDDYLTKPVSTAVLHKTVFKYFKKKQSPDD
jgi:PAS domain S-box-containing protein